MKNVLTYLVLLIVFVLQSTVCRYIEILHTIPNLLLVFVVCYSMHAEPLKATVLATITGLLIDLYGAKHLGLNAIMMMYLGLALSCISSDFIRTNFFTVLVAVVISTFLYEGIYAFLVYFIFSKISVGVLFTVVSYETVYNLVVACGMMWLCRYLAYDEVRSF